MSPSEETMSKIRSQSPVLNAKLNATNDLFARREAELREANVQIRFWWERCFDEHAYIDDNGEEVVEYWMVGLLEGPSFGARLMRLYEGRDVITEIRSPIPLSAAPFLVRVEAAQSLDQFLAELAAEMTRLVTRLDETLMTCASTHLGQS